MASKKTEPKAWLQELKANRQTQVALVGFIAVLTWLLWPEPPKKPRRAATPSGGSQTLDSRQIAALKRLPDLAKLDRARELPSESRMVRDLFVFDGPQPIIIPKVVKVEPPKPPTPEELAARQLQAEKDAELNLRPASLRYLGYIESPSAGRLGSFLKGEVPELHKPGAMVGTRWKLLKLSDRKAEFQNTKFFDLTFTLEARDSVGTTPAGAAVSNEF